MKVLAAVFFFTIGLMSCSSQKSLEKDPPFTVERPTVQYWTGGREESGHGMEFQARFNPVDPAAMGVDSLYFRGHILGLEVSETETGFLLKASYAQSGWEKPDMIMDADSIRQVGNQPPMPLPPMPFPFELEPDEAVISYHLKADPGKKYYTKIGGVVELAPRIFPGRPPH